MAKKKTTKKKNPFQAMEDFYDNCVAREDKKGNADLFKKATKVFFDSLKKEIKQGYPFYEKGNLKSLTVTDLKYLDGYFIFGMGTNSVVHFHIKEIPGWLFAIWWGEVKQEKGVQYKTLKGTFFTQYEDNIDKFKPSRSEIQDELYITINVKGEIGTSTFSTLSILNFMYKQPHLAFCRDYKGWNYNTEYHTAEEAKQEFLTYKKDRANEIKYKKICDDKAISIIKKFYKDELEAGSVYIIDEGECVSPRYEIAVNKDAFEALKKYKPGCYGIYQVYLEEDVNNLEKEMKAIDKISNEHNVGWFNPIGYNTVYLYDKKQFDKCKIYKMKEVTK